MDHVETEIVTLRSYEDVLIEKERVARRIVGVEPEGSEVGQKAIHSQVLKSSAFVHFHRSCHDNHVRVSA